MAFKFIYSVVILALGAVGGYHYTSAIYEEAAEASIIFDLESDLSLFLKIISDLNQSEVDRVQQYISVLAEGDAYTLREYAKQFDRDVSTIEVLREYEDAKSMLKLP